VVHPCDTQPGNIVGNNKPGIPKKDKIDPTQVFQQATFFDYSARVLSQLARARLTAFAAAQGASGPIATGTVSLADCTMPTLFPAGVSAALCVELYLKALLFQENDGQLPTKQIHTLSDLFTALKIRARARIESLYKVAFESDENGRHIRDTSANPGEFDLTSTLQRHNRTFQDVRYFYELACNWEFDTLEPLRHALVVYSLEINPNWVRYWAQLGPPPTLLFR
jgi:hypothetical protein